MGTPIGNLGDLSFRGLETLREADLIVAEDTRHTRRLTDRYEIGTRMMSCHKFNEKQRAEQIIERIQDGQAVAMVTDSGMPCISDPGSRVVLLCQEAGIPITSVPGPAAVTTAVALSGFGESGFIFAGFLPHKSGGRRRDLEKWNRWSSMNRLTACSNCSAKSTNTLDRIERCLSGASLQRNSKNFQLAPLPRSFCTTKAAS